MNKQRFEAMYFDTCYCGSDPTDCVCEPLPDYEECDNCSDIILLDEQYAFELDNKTYCEECYNALFIEGETELCTKIIKKNTVQYGNKTS